MENSRRCGLDRVVEDEEIQAPSHYRQGGIECIDAIQASMTPEQFTGYLKGNVIKYLWRFEHKGGLQDLGKAKWYSDALIQHVGKEQEKPA